MLVAKSLAPVMFRLDGAAPCAFPKESEFGGFLSGDRIVISFRHETEIRILTPDCSLLDSWKINGPAGVLDTSPEQDLLAIEGHSAIELVAARDHGVKQRWGGDTINSFQGRLHFFRSGQASLQRKLARRKTGSGRGLLGHTDRGKDSGE